MPELQYLSPAAAQFHSNYVEVDNPAYPIRLNSRPYMRPTGSSIGFQSKPNLVVASTGDLIGGEVMPRVAPGCAVNGIIGLHASAWAQSTVALPGGNITGDVRALAVQLDSDAGGTRAIGGNLSGIRISANAQGYAGGVTGIFAAVRVMKSQNKDWDGVLDLEGTYGPNNVWDDADTNAAGTKRGAIKVVVNGTDRWIRLYTSGV